MRRNVALAEELRQAGFLDADEEAQLLADAAESAADRQALLRRRLTGEPLEFILGWAEFSGQRISVGPGVFIPRRRSEFLARVAADTAREASAAGKTDPYAPPIPATPDVRAPEVFSPQRAGPPAGSRPVVLELCCGTAAISVVVAKAVPEAELHAADILPAAVACAGTNLGERGQVYTGDLYEPLPPALHGQIDVIVANAPYVPTAQLDFLPREARLHEPRETHDGGSDGLAVLGRIAAQAHLWLAPAGVLLVECSAEQVPELSARLHAAGLESVPLQDAGATVLRGVKAPGS